MSKSHASLRAIAPEYRSRFEAARQKLLARGWKVTRTGYDHGLYYVEKGNKEIICSVWDVIERGEALP
ncbi:MAG: hypothetical protein IPP13_18785 [Kouleothrix sp.]|jgi:hypothetical protein|nr:hypothetical protein [Kouleothrix sp.]